MRADGNNGKKVMAMAAEVARVDRGAGTAAAITIPARTTVGAEEAVAEGRSAPGRAGEAVPAAAERGQRQQDEAGRAELEKALAKMNVLLSDTPVRLSFRLHEESGRMMVQVVDLETGEVIKEMPPHELLDTVARIMRFVGLLLDRMM